MANFLFILNGPPYGNEHSFNGLRLADNLARHEDNEVKVFLIGDAAACAKRGQKVPHGFYNIELMLHPILRHEGQIGVCATCMDARGITDEELAEGCHRSSMEELTSWTLWADKVLVF
jgi:uncharacterized protein involved in oxidation of intracellular sulfur